MATTRKAHGSLFSSRLRGGVLGGAGYNFQDAYIVTALPGWLGDPAFRSFIKEGFEDVDALFDGKGSTYIWHYQLKDHPVAPSEFRDVLTGFEMAARRVGVNVTRLILGCTGLAPSLASLWRLVEEFRGARRAHSEAALLETRRDLETRLAKLKLAHWTELIVDRIEIDHENSGLRDTDPAVLMERFRGKFMTLPLYDHEGPAVLDRLFTRLMLSINKAIRRGIGQQEIVSVIEEELGAATKEPATVVYLHGWARQHYDIPADVEIDWTEHFDRGLLRVAPPEVWLRTLLPALRDLRARFDAEWRRRAISLRARAPLSAGLAFGHAFAEAAGYSITVLQPSPGVGVGIQYWRTDSPPDGVQRLDIRVVAGEAANGEVAVGIGITDDAQPQVEQYLDRVGLNIRATLYLSPPGGPSPTSVDQRNVGSIAAALKSEMRRFANQHGAQLIHLFYFGPLGLAVLLGQKLNGLPDIQCYERDKAVGYTPSCRLRA